MAALVQSNPVIMARQAVTEAIAPSAAAPSCCLPTTAGSFGIYVQNISAAGQRKRQDPSQIADGQIQLPTMAPVSMITDGQVQAGLHTVMMLPIANQISDGQVQVQNFIARVTEFKDGQPQAPTVAPLPSPSMIAAHVAITASPLPESSGLSPATSASSEALPASSSPASASSDCPPSSSPIVQCNNGFGLTLADSQLTDQNGRTGYIASNFQLQFDKPPQAGAIYTSGFSVCGNGSLALGGSNIFYQCLSGNFYNLYDRHWAAQCSPITLSTAQLVDCRGAGL